KLAAAVAEHRHLAAGIVLLPPGPHDKGVVDRETGDLVDALFLERGSIPDIARQVARRAGPGIGAGDPEQRDLFALEIVVARDRLAPVRGQKAQCHARHLVADLDRHRRPLPRCWFGVAGLTLWDAEHGLAGDAAGEKPHADRRDLVPIVL